MQNKEIRCSDLVTKNLKDYMLYAANLSKWEIHDEFDDTVFIINGSREFLFNFVFCDNELSIQKTLNYLKARNIQATWVYVKKRKILAKYGIKHVSTPKKALLNVTNYFLPPDVVPNLKLKIIDNNQLLEQLDLYTSKIFNHNIGAVSEFFRGLPNDTSKLRLFFATLNDEFIGTCGIYIQDNVAGFYSDGVLPIYRNQGIGTQMVLERIKIAQKFKCKYAVAHCMKSSINLYERLGFKMFGNLYLYTSSV
ncbi:GNAT family N-acetyltransferase [Wolbachia endosymbiont of Chironomus riparius]|uniref:GNAT family N-acetyltransferase n=1 Tax=Wolbachia endosymbiont of Chironomus riparius TaxID=2883238 RepID=UPI0020A10B8F|nr:GNAT family N-acetyltransferase [Wolbachia endosymbiont of Chironomus riparius]